MTYDGEIATFDREIVERRLVFQSVADATRFIESLPENTIYVLIGQSKGGVSFGDFMIWFAGQRAYVRLDEHREHIASEANPLMGKPKVSFRDTDGSSFEVSWEETVPRESAIRALLAWLPSRKKSTEFNWD